MELLTVIETRTGVEVRNADRAVFSVGRYQEQYTLRLSGMLEDAQLRREDFKELTVLDDLLLLRYHEQDGWTIRKKEIVLGNIAPSEELQRAIRLANERGTYFLDVGGLRIDVNDFWPYPWLQRPQERGYTHVRAGEGRWTMNENGQHVIYDLAMVFDGNRSDFELMLRYRVQSPDGEHGRPFDPDKGIAENADLIILRGEEDVRQLLRDRNIALRERVSIDDVLRGQDGIQIMMGMDPPKRYDP